MAAANLKRKGASAAAADALTASPFTCSTYVEYTHVPEYDQLPVARDQKNIQTRKKEASDDI